MQMAWSANRTCKLLRSASEYTATVWMPRSLQAQMTRTAISPRLAMRIFWNMSVWENSRSTRANGEQSLAVLHWPAALHQLGHDGSGNLRFYFVHQLHRFDNTEHLSRLHRVAHLDERRIARLRRFIKRADDRRLDDVFVRRGRRLARAGLPNRLPSRLPGLHKSGRRGGRHRHGHRHLLPVQCAANANAYVAPLQLQLSDTAFNHQLDQLSDFVIRHSREVLTP